MTSSFYLVMALCAGQVSGTSATQYGYPNSQSGQNQFVSQPVSQSYVRPQAPTGPLRTWLKSFGPRAQSQAPCDCNNGQNLKSTSPYTPVASQPYTSPISSNYTSPYQPIKQINPAPFPVSVNQYEESNVRGNYQQMPVAPGYSQSSTTSSYQPQPGSPVYLEQPIPSTIEGQPIPAYQEPPIQGTNPNIQNPSINLSNLNVAKKYEKQIGHETDYSWITGHLFYVHANGGRWVVRYALPGEVDKFGGSVVLAPGVEMKNFREGDLVCIYGEILDEGRTSASLGGALYRVNSILMIERADQ